MKSFEKRQTLAEPESLIFDEKRYIQKAEELYRDNYDALVEEPLNSRQAIRNALAKFPDETLAHYWGHGVTRGTPETQIAALLSMLENKVYFGYAGTLVGGQPNAYTNGSFFVISRKGGLSFMKGMQEGRPQRVSVTSQSGEKHVGMRMDPGAFVVNGHMEPLLASLRSLYPDEKIISATELGDYIREQELVNP